MRKDRTLISVQYKGSAEGTQLFRGCFNPDRLFAIGNDNRVIFCNGKKGRLIDDYIDREELYEDFLRTCGDYFCAYQCKLTDNNSLSFQYTPQDLAGYSVKRSVDKAVFAYGRHYPGKIFCFPCFYCNNDCLHCFGGDKAKRKNPTLKELKDMISACVNEYNELHIGGGEPTLFKELVGLIRFSKEKGLIVWLLSNGRRFHDKQFACRVASSGLDGMIICIHSHRSSVHDAITRRPGSLRETIEGIRNLKSIGFNNIDVIIVVHKQNYKELTSLCRFLINEGIGTIAFESLLYVGSAARNIDSLGLKLSEAVKELESAASLLIGEGIDFRLTSYPLCLFKRRFWKYFTNRRYELLASNFPHGDKGSFYWRYKSAWLSLVPRCVDCKLKTFCAGIWPAYYHFFGDEELEPVRDIDNSGLLGLVSSQAVNRALAFP